MRLGKALEDKLMDTRLRDKLVAEGKVTPAQVEAFLNQISDESANMTSIDDRSKSSNNDSLTSVPTSSKKYVLANVAPVTLRNMVRTSLELAHV